MKKFAALFLIVAAALLLATPTFAQDADLSETNDIAVVDNGALALADDEDTSLDMIDEEDSDMPEDEDDSHESSDLQEEEELFPLAAILVAKIAAKAALKKVAVGFLKSKAVGLL